MSTFTRETRESRTVFAAYCIGLQQLMRRYTHISTHSQLDAITSVEGPYDRNAEQVKRRILSGIMPSPIDQANVPSEYIVMRICMFFYCLWHSQMTHNVTDDNE